MKVLWVRDMVLLVVLVVEERWVCGERWEYWGVRGVDLKKHSSREVGYGVGTLRVETELDKVSMEKEQRNRLVLVEKLDFGFSVVG